jgi:L-erythro-3,5-diaminohexanoate dehydrogenase
VEAVADVVEEIRRLGVADQVFHLDSRDAIGTYQVLRGIMGESLFDLTINTTNTENTEGASILATKPGGRLILFNMSTSFTRAALTAEGVGRDINMLIGNGFTKNWIERTLRIYRSYPELAEFMIRRGILQGSRIQ